ncbi:MAG: 3'-5' exonuclease, partial [Eubacterium sp.]
AIGRGEKLMEELNSYGIPAYCDISSGYFSSSEITVILDMLTILDNPHQDIPLVSVLKSPMFNFTAVEMATVSAYCQGKTYFESISEYSKGGSNIETANKIKAFLEKYNSYRKMSVYMPISELIEYIITDTNYYNYISSMQTGKRRIKNIEMLKEKAVSFESGIYKGLFNFVRYIDKLKKYDIDFGQATEISENDDTVRIMTIHKSKGLQFPIVFVAGLGTKFNIMDSSGQIAINSTYGIGADNIDGINKIKSPTLIKKAISQKITEDNKAEEMRILYVALTRAQEKLILIGTTKSLSKKIVTWTSERFSEEQKISYNILIRSNSFLDWIAYALVRNQAFQYVYNYSDITIPLGNSLYFVKSHIISTIYTSDNIIENSFVDFERNRQKETALTNWNTEIIFDESIQEVLKKQFEYSYPYNSDTVVSQALSVSEIKKEAMVYEETDDELIEEERIFPLIPEFISGEIQSTGAFRGTAYHKVFELFDFNISKQSSAMEQFVNGLLSEGKLDKRSASVINPDKLVIFANSQLAERMHKADDNCRLYREQQFIIGVPAKELKKEYDSERLVLLQGIVDAFFIEDNEIVIIDYKTDKVNNYDELIRRYKVQLDLYQKAVEQITNMHVKEKIIYSVHLGGEITL